jgi:hypothetical protein
VILEFWKWVLVKFGRFGGECDVHQGLKNFVAMRYIGVIWEEGVWVLTSEEEIAKIETP